MQKILAWLAQGRVALFMTTFLMTLLCYVLRGVGLLTIVPGWVLLILFALSYLLFFLALHPKRQFW